MTKDDLSLLSKLQEILDAILSQAANELSPYHALLRIRDTLDDALPPTLQRTDKNQ